MTLAQTASDVAAGSDAGSDVVASRLARFVDRLGLVPVDAAPDVCARLMALTGGAFARQLSDPAYAANALCPGGWPIEVSYREDDPAAVRVDLAPLDPQAAPEERLMAAIELARVTHEAFASWSAVLAARRFGGFVGASIRGERNAVEPVTTKAYLELARGVAPGELPEPIATHVSSLARYVPGLRAHLVALAGDSRRCPPRIYLECASGVAMLSLLDWAEAHGLAEPALAMVHAVRRLAGGRLVLPEASVLLAIAPVTVDEPHGVELKVELSRHALAPDCADIVRQVLVNRPVARGGYERFMSAVLPVTELTVVSVRIATGMPGPRLNVYAELLDHGTASGERPS